jgi:hypothetical protein
MHNKKNNEKKPVYSLTMGERGWMGMGQQN